jgi:hypothetical protein
MRTSTAALSGVILSMAIVSACSKPAETKPEIAAAVPEASSDAATGAGGAVSPPPANGNEAVNTDGNTTETTQSPGSNSFTEAQARSHLESAGYGDVTELTKTADGFWVGKARKDGKAADVSVDFKGAVTTR